MYQLHSNIRYVNSDKRQLINFSCLLFFILLYFVFLFKLNKNSMKIFNVDIFSTDAEWFINQSKEVKKQWILDNTNQKNDDLIEEFLNSNTIVKTENCINCGTLDDKIINPFTDGNKRKTISTEVATDVIDSNTKGNGGGGNTKRRRNNKGS